MAKDYFIGLGIVQIVCGLMVFGTQVLTLQRSINLDLTIQKNNFTADMSPVHLDLENDLILSL